MKKAISSRTFLSLAIIFYSTQALPQSTIQNIAFFSKAWGLLKYHHPDVASGNMDWDSLFVNTIPVVQETKSMDEFEKILSQVLDRLSPLGTTTAPMADSLFSKNASDNWLEERKFASNSLKKRLLHIATHRIEKENKYIKLKNLTADYGGEKTYDSLVFPEKNYRLLFLARFWCAINYFAPYKYLLGTHWDSVLLTFIPKMIKAKDKLSYYKVLLELAASLHDGHSQVTNSADTPPINDLIFGKYAPPFFTAIIDGKLVVTKVIRDSLGREKGIRAGDIIVQVDHEPIKNRMRRLAKYISASNSQQRFHLLNWTLLNTDAAQEDFVIFRRHQRLHLQIHPIDVAQRSWKDLCDYTYNNNGYKSVGRSIAYVYAAQIWDGNLDSIMLLIHRKAAVIFDVRNYPNNDAFYNVLGMFLTQPRPINYNLVMIPSNPGYFRWQLSPLIGNTNSKPYQGKVILLADERTQSQGEYSVMTLQTISQAVTIGSTTAGADGVVTRIPMGGKLSISYSGYGIFYPDKRPTQQVGIRIDIPVRKRIKDVVENRDPIFEKAIDYLKQSGIE